MLDGAKVICEMLTVESVECSEVTSITVVTVENGHYLGQWQYSNERSRISFLRINFMHRNQWMITQKLEPGKWTFKMIPSNET